MVMEWKTILYSTFSLLIWIVMGENSKCYSLTPLSINLHDASPVLKLSNVHANWSQCITAHHMQPQVSLGCSICPQSFHTLMIIQFKLSHPVKYYITVPSDRLWSALVLAVGERSPVDPAQRVISFILEMRVPAPSAPCRLRHLCLLCGAPGGEVHPASQHQRKGDPSKVQCRSPVSPQQFSPLQWLTGVMTRPGCGDQQQDPRQNKERTRKHFDLTPLREPHCSRRSDRWRESPSTHGRHDEGSPRPKTSRKRQERLVEGAVQAAIVVQVPVIPFQPHPVPVGRQGSGGVVQGAAHLPQSQAACQNGTKPPSEGQTEGSELQLPFHDSGRPACSSSSLQA